jgi:hypothetical protein
MALVRRLDHIILCGRDRREWVPLIDQVLDLRPRRSREGDEWGFSNAEFDIGDGFLGLVEPAGPDSQLRRFLDRFPEGFYAMSVDVGDFDQAAVFLTERGVQFRTALRGGEVGLLWVPPSVTGGVLYQLTPNGEVAQGTNPHYLGISSMVVAVDDVDDALAAYSRCFGLDDARPVADERLAYQGAELSIPGAPLGDTIVLAAPAGTRGPVAEQLRERGPGICQFSILVGDLARELERLEKVGVGVESTPGVAWVDPGALRGVRVELRAVG